MADSVWLLLMFDLPTKEAQQRKNATAYRNFLLDRGFTMVQLSVYAKYCINATGAIPTINALKAAVPPEGSVRIYSLTDRQWAGGWRLVGDKYIAPEEPPEQLLLFDF